MLELQLEARGITRPEVVAAFAAVPREAFVPKELEPRAYDDTPLSIGGEQTISQPYVVARTLDALELSGEDRVLEVGTGSGYAAALLGSIAREVYTVERIDWLAEQAGERLARLGFGNVHVRHGDGTLGLHEHAPYDAIAVAAGGPVVPQPLLDQLAVGGRLVMPVTAPTGVGQTLVRVRRVSERDFEKEELEEVTFVPLIGAQGHPEEAEPVVLTALRLARPESALAAARLVGEVAERFEAIDDPRVEALVERLAPARIVLLGESTHGSSEFYRLRARITAELIAKHGFDFVAVEADWPDAERLDAEVRRTKLATTRFDWKPFSRFPIWMWRNAEVRAFVDWLRGYNGAHEHESRGVGFHGLDLYSMYTSMGIVSAYLDELDPDAARTARRRYSSLMPWQETPEGYGLAVATGRLEAAEPSIVATLRDLLRERLTYAKRDGERFFDAAQNARVVASAEAYYRAMYYGAAESWNLRDSHMFDTLRLLLGWYGPQSRGIVWAHNTHVGDARATEMRERHEHNLGQLCRQAFGEDAVALVGFGTHHGTVLAAREWDEPGEAIAVRPGHPESYEHVLHASGVPAFVLRLRDPARAAVREELTPARLLRAIGVVYSPETELASHYVHAVLPREFDELVWFDETSAVHPLAVPA